MARHGLPPASLAVADAPDQVEQEHHLGEADDQRHDADEGVEVVRRLRDERHVAELVVAARHADQAEIVHREEDQVGAEEGDPEVELAQRLVEHAAGDLRIPVIDRAEDHQ